MSRKKKSFFLPFLGSRPPIHTRSALSFSFREAELPEEEEDDDYDDDEAAGICISARIG